MTVLDLPRTAEPTPQSQRLADLEQRIAATRAELASAWGDVAAKHLKRLEQDRAELLGLTATSVLGA